MRTRPTRVCILCGGKSACKCCGGHLPTSRGARQSAGCVTPPGGVLRFVFVLLLLLLVVVVVVVVMVVCVIVVAASDDSGHQQRTRRRLRNEPCRAFGRVP
jgi:hypothetical protein